jgi:hypothetical protein
MTPTTSGNKKGRSETPTVTVRRNPAILKTSTVEKSNNAPSTANAVQTKLIHQSIVDLDTKTFVHPSGEAKELNEMRGIEEDHKIWKALDKSSVRYALLKAGSTPSALTKRTDETCHIMHATATMTAQYR